MLYPPASERLSLVGDIISIERSRCFMLGGRVAMVGIGAVEMKLPVVDALLRQVDIRGTFRYRPFRVVSLFLLGESLSGSVIPILRVLI